MRWALAIDEHSYGPDHSDVATALNNLAQLLQDTNRLEDAEPLMRRGAGPSMSTATTQTPQVATPPQQPGRVALGHEPAERTRSP